MVIVISQKISQILKSKLFLFCVAGILTTQAVYPFLPWRIEITEDVSLPYTVWLAHTKYNPAKDQYIEFPPPVHNEYTKGVKTLVKQVGCVAGQELTVNAQTHQYYCDGYYLGMAQKTDRKGKKVDPFEYNGIIPKGKIFATGTHARSYDSRYFGFINVATVERGVIPLW